MLTGWKSGILELYSDDLFHLRNQAFEDRFNIFTSQVSRYNPTWAGGEENVLRGFHFGSAGSLGDVDKVGAAVGRGDDDAAAVR